MAVAAAVVLLSVIVANPVAGPDVRVKLAAVLLVTTMLESERPATPETENNGGDNGSDNQRVLTPVTVTVAEVLAPTPGGAGLS